MMEIASETIAGCSCLTANLAGCDKGAVVVIGGTRLMRRIARLVENGELDLGGLPCFVGVDAPNELHDLTPWWHPAFKEEAPDFGGGGDRFLDETVIPIARSVRVRLDDAGSSEAPLTMMGYSLGGLLCLQALMRTDVFDRYLVASPSVWYPGFVNRLERTELAGDPLVAIACGADEGASHPEPIAGIRQDVNRTHAVLSRKLSRTPSLSIDGGDHHQGLNARLVTLLSLA